MGKDKDAHGYENDEAISRCVCVWCGWMGGTFSGRKAREDETPRVCVRAVSHECVPVTCAPARGLYRRASFYESSRQISQLCLMAILLIFIEGCMYVRFRDPCWGIVIAERKIAGILRSIISKKTVI